MKAHHVVFIVHEASRTGAPILLLHLATWFKRNTDWTFEVVLLVDGPLAVQFREIGPVTLYEPRWAWELLDFAPRWRRRMAWVVGAASGLWLKAKLRRSRPSLIYYNTMAVGEVVNRLGSLQIPSIVHVHELESVIRFIGVDAMEKIEQTHPQYIAASNAVADNLVRNHAIPRDQIEVIHEFITIPEVPADDPVLDRARLCERLGIPTDSVIVGGSGTIEHRKGVDLFVDAARHLLALKPTRPIHFLWMGRRFDESFSQQLQTAIEEAGLGGTVHFLGQVAEPFGTLRHFDIFALTSREDPYPLAMLEAGGLGVPVVGFADSGGAPEYIEQDAGVIVPFEDTHRMASVIYELAHDLERARALGACGARKVRARHTLDLTAPRVFELIKRVAGVES